MKLPEGEFVCVGCGERFFTGVATRCALADDDEGDEKIFHSPDCMSAWERRQR